jgi:hypothetical protein
MFPAEVQQILVEVRNLQVNDESMADWRNSQLRARLQDVIQNAPAPLAREAELQFVRNLSANLGEVIEENEKNMLRTRAVVAEVHEHGLQGREMLARDTSQAIAAVERTTEEVARDARSEFAILAERTVQSQAGVETLMAALRRCEEELCASPPRPGEILEAPQVGAVEDKVRTVTETVAQLVESQRAIEGHLTTLLSSPQTELRESKEQATVAVGQVRQLQQRFNNYAQEMGTVLEKIKDENYSKFQEMKSKIEAERRELQAIKSEYQQGMSEVLRLREEFENSQEQRAREWGELSSKLSGSSTTRTNFGVPPPHCRA